MKNTWGTLRKALQSLRPLDEKYQSALRFSFALQTAALTTAALALDSGVLFRLACCSLLPFWVMAVLVMLRRPASPSKADVIAIKYGFAAHFVVLSALNALGGR